MTVTDLKVYSKLYSLAVEIHELTMEFPKFEMYEIGSQLGRSSNSSPANLAEGFGNKHTNIFCETISRAQGEIRETLHHLRMALAKKYLTDGKYNYFISEYETCAKMLYGLDKSLSAKHQS